MNIFFVVGIGIALVLLLWAAGRSRSGTGSPSPQEFSASALPSVVLPSRALLAQCFSADDVDFVARLKSRQLSRLLFQERRRLAVEWLRQTQRQAVRVFRFHVSTVRHAADLRPGMEFRLLLHAGAFFVICQFLLVLVRLYGPLRAHVFVRSVSFLGGVLSDLGGRIVGVASPGAVHNLAESA